MTKISKHIDLSTLSFISYTNMEKMVCKLEKHIQVWPPTLKTYHPHHHLKLTVPKIYKFIFAVVKYIDVIVKQNEIYFSMRG